MANSASPITLRLSPDALRLELFLAPDAPVLPAGALSTLIHERAAQLQVPLSLKPVDLETIVQSNRRGTWITLLSGTPPTAPTDGRVELLVPVPVSSERQRLLEGRCAVRAGAAIARLRHGVNGQPGRDLLHREIAARPPRAARLPGGQNTEVSPDGMVLFASCDGEVVLRNLLIHVEPMYVHFGDVTSQDEVLVTRLPVFITGSVQNDVHISVERDVHVQGDVFKDAHVQSKQGSVTIDGIITGTTEHQPSVYACDDIFCGAALHARLQAGKDIRLLNDARHSTLQAGGNLYLRHSIDHSLQHVQLSVGGGVIPLIEPPSPLREVPTDRRHFRVATNIAAHIALHSTGSLLFQPCTIVDLSTGGARCQFPQGISIIEWPPETIVQLKFTLPGSDDQLLAVGQVSRQIRQRVLGLAFLQMAQDDQERVTAYCLQLLMARSHSHLAVREDRTP